MKTPLLTPVAILEPPQGCPVTAAPTPQPWRIAVCEVTGAIWIERRTGGTKEAVCKMGPNFGKDRDLANAELILQALNSHERLGALESSLNVFRGWFRTMKTLAKDWQHEAIEFKRQLGIANDTAATMEDVLIEIALLAGRKSVELDTANVAPPNYSQIALMAVRGLTFSKLRGVEITDRRCRQIGMPRYAQVGDLVNDAYILIIDPPHESAWIVGREQLRFLTSARAGRMAIPISP